MAGVTTVLMGTVMVASSVHSQDWSDGCRASRGSDQSVWAERLDPWVQTVLNNTDQSSLLASWKLWPGSGSEATAASWGLATLYTDNTRDYVLHNTTEPQHRPHYFMENVVIMTDCSQGQSMWRLTSVNKVPTFVLTNNESFTIVATEEMPLRVIVDNSPLTLCTKDNSFLKPCNIYREGLPAHAALRLQFTLSDTRYQVVLNGEVVRNTRWRSPPSKNLTFTLPREGTTKPIYLIHHHLPLTHRPTPQDPPVVSAVVVTLSVVVAGQAVILLCLLWHFTDVCTYLPCKRSGVRSMRINGNKSFPGHHPPPTTSTSKEASPLPPPRTANTLADPLHHIAEESHDDCEVDYVTPQAVKPLEVEILKQQNVILGQISHQASPWSTLTHSHKPDSRKNSEASHHTISRQQSVDTTHTYNSNYNNEDEPNYMNVTREDGVVRLHREPSDIYDNVDTNYDTVHDTKPRESSDIYDTVDTNYDTVHDTKPRESSDIYDTVENYNYYHLGDKKY